MPRVNYDTIAHLYDEPGRDHQADPAVLRYLKDHLHVTTSGVRVLDIGCGTGKQLGALHSVEPTLQLIGIDRYRGMLDVAQTRRSAADLVHGDGARLPFGDGQFDVVLSQFSYHHIPQKAALIQEVYRVLKRGGRFSLWNIDPWHMMQWAIYQVFPEALGQDTADFTPGEQLALLMTQAGFQNVSLNREVQPSEQTVAEFTAYVEQRHRASNLMAIRDDAYEAGMSRLRDALAKGAAEYVLRSETCLLTITAEKPAT